MSLLRNLTGITTPASTDLFYVVQNNTDYKMTSEQFLNFAKSAIVVSLTQAQYDALTPAEKSNGSIYLINDATLSASDIAYGQGTVEDSLDELTAAVSDKVNKLYFLNGSATVNSNLSPTGIIKAGVVPSNILRGTYQGILVINNSNANVYKAYIRRDNGNLCAGENITAGTYAFTSILALE